MSLETINLWKVWLSKQRHWEDPVGDFARDFLEDPSAIDLCTLSAIDSYLKASGRDDRVLDARDKAWREYALEVREVAFEENVEPWDL